MTAEPMKPLTKLSKIEWRKFALEMASTQVGAHRYAPDNYVTGARDVVAMARIYYAWLVRG